jgi:hypothetical protein
MVFVLCVGAMLLLLVCAQMSWPASGGDHDVSAQMSWPVSGGDHDVSALLVRLPSSATAATVPVKVIRVSDASCIAALWMRMANQNALWLSKCGDARGEGYKHGRRECCEHVDQSDWTGGGCRRKPKTRKCRMRSQHRSLCGVAARRVRDALLQTTERICWVPDDGNCFFSAIALGLGESGVGQAEVRQAIVSEEADVWYGSYCEGDETLDEHRCEMAQPRTWGGEMELVAAASNYNIEILVYDTSVK